MNFNNNPSSQELFENKNIKLIRSNNNDDEKDENRINDKLSLYFSLGPLTNERKVAGQFLFKEDPTTYLLWTFIVARLQEKEIENKNNSNAGEVSINYLDLIDSINNNNNINNPTNRLPNSFGIINNRLAELINVKLLEVTVIVGPQYEPDFLISFKNPNFYTEDPTNPSRINISVQNDFSFRLQYKYLLGYEDLNILSFYEEFVKFIKQYNHFPSWTQLVSFLEPTLKKADTQELFEFTFYIMVLNNIFEMTPLHFTDYDLEPEYEDEFQFQFEPNVISMQIPILEKYNNNSSTSISTTGENDDKDSVMMFENDAQNLNINNEQYKPQQRDSNIYRNQDVSRGSLFLNPAIQNDDITTLSPLFWSK